MIHMRKAFSAMLVFAALTLVNSTVTAAELRTVVPTVAGTAVSVDISADTAMTYTYYTITGQPRAVVDIAEVDPEKIEPLIVVNKGIVSSISVDKVQISGIIVSRIIFNLVSESNIAVSATADRKQLTVTFSGSLDSSGRSAAKSGALPDSTHASLPASAGAQTAAENLPAGIDQDDDPLEIDAPVVKPGVPAAVTTAPLAGAAVSLPVVVPAALSPKLEPVVPLSTAPAQSPAQSVQEITTGASYIDIRTSRPVVKYKAVRITRPDRIVIDIPGKNIHQKPKTVAIRKFGVSKIRIGGSTNHIRIVLDSGAAKIPSHTITVTGEGVRIHFK